MGFLLSQRNGEARFDGAEGVEQQGNGLRLQIDLADRELIVAHREGGGARKRPSVQVTPGEKRAVLELRIFVAPVILRAEQRPGVEPMKWLPKLKIYSLFVHINKIPLIKSFHIQELPHRYYHIQEIP